MTDGDAGVDLVLEAEVVGFEVESASAPDRIAVETAKAHPRSIEQFRKDLGMLATMDEESAGSMFYSLKRGDKIIEGPSVRFAECVLYAFGNMRVFGKVIDVGASELVAEAAAWDLQQNTQIGKRVTRRITYKNGSRYNADMIAMTSNAAVSIAVRNVVLASVPRPWYKAAYDAAVKTSTGSEKTVKTRRKEWLSWWKEEGGTPEQMWEWLGIRGADDIDGFALVRLQGLKNATKEGMTTFQREMDMMSSTEDPDDEAAQLDAHLVEAK